jgi:type III pantothenate kinase
MMHRASHFDPDQPIIVIDIGNSTTAVGTWRAGRVKTPLEAPTDDLGAFREGLAEHARACPKGRPAATVIGSVVPEALERIRACAFREFDKEALVVGDNVPLPMDVAVDDASAIGVDRVCSAAAVFEKLQSACTIVDFGTAVTVDLVDDDGQFLGGAILPGINLQLRALHEHTAALPLVSIADFRLGGTDSSNSGEQSADRKPQTAIPKAPYGRNTAEAMQNGVCLGIAGAVRSLVEGYATSLKRWPQVVATGGDLSFIAPHCDFLDTLVSDLTLQGIGLAYRKHMTARGA